MALTVKLAEALLRRKELQQKVDRYAKINIDGLFETKVQRKMASEGIDDVVAAVPKISLSQVNACYDYHAKHLRLIDAAIQNANWNTPIEVDENAMKDWIDPVGALI
jgi:hypothetical protein